MSAVPESAGMLLDLQVARWRGPEIAPSFCVTKEGSARPCRMKNSAMIGSVPLWAWVLVGWMAASAGTAIWQRGSLERAIGDPKALVESVAIDWDLDAMSARELQALPGIGEKRAVDVVEARWQHDPADGDFDLESVRGIGEKTAAAARIFVGERRATP